MKITTTYSILNFFILTNYALHSQYSREEQRKRLKGAMTCAYMPKIQLLCGIGDPTRKMPHEDCRWDNTHGPESLKTKKCRIGEYCSMSVEFFDFDNQEIIDQILGNGMGTVVNGSLGCKVPPRESEVRKDCIASDPSFIEKKLECLCNDSICNRYRKNKKEIRHKK